MLGGIWIDLFRATVQVLTSRWLSEDQIRGLSANIVGGYLSDWLPTPKQEREASSRVGAAQNHIAEASRIIAGLRTDLDGQAQHLNQLVKDIKEKKIAAVHYAALARINQETFAPMRVEMEAVIRDQLQKQANEGTRIRQIALAIVWLVTLVLGAALGATFSLLSLFSAHGSACKVGTTRMPSRPSIGLAPPASPVEPSCQALGRNERFFIGDMHGN